MKSHFNCTIERLRLLLSELKKKKETPAQSDVINQVQVCDQ